MLHNDISNKQSFVIGFRCENSLFKFKDTGVLDKLANAILGKFNRAELDKDVYSAMEYIYWNTEYTVVLVIDEENYTEDNKKFLEDFPFNRVATVIRSKSEITMMLNTGYLTLFVSNDTIDRDSVNSRYAIDLNTLNTILRRQVKRIEI